MQVVGILACAPTDLLTMANLLSSLAETDGVAAAAGVRQILSFAWGVSAPGQMRKTCSEILPRDEFHSWQQVNGPCEKPERIFVTCKERKKLINCK